MVRSVKGKKTVHSKKLSQIVARKSLNNSYSSILHTPESRISGSFLSTPQQKTPRPTPKSSGKKRRLHPGTKSLREIRRLQKTTNLLIPKLPFMRLVQEVMMSQTNTQYRIQSAALEALQEMTELLMVDLFSEAVLCSIHAHRRTVMVSDMQLARRIRGRDDIINP